MEPDHLAGNRLTALRDRVMEEGENVKVVYRK